MNAHSHNRSMLNPLPGETPDAPEGAGQQPVTQGTAAPPPLPNAPLTGTDDVKTIPEEVKSTPAPMYAATPTAPESKGIGMDIPIAVKVMAGAIALLLVVIVCLAFRQTSSPSVQAATAVAKDSDIEIQGTSQVVDAEWSWMPPKYIFKGHVTNTGASTAPTVTLNAVFHYNYRNRDNSRQPLVGTVLLSTFKNLRPGESRDFECPADVPQQPDPAPGTEAETFKFPCNVYGDGLPCFGGGLHNVPQPESVTTEATVTDAGT